MRVNAALGISVNWSLGAVGIVEGVPERRGLGVRTQLGYFLVIGTTHKIFESLTFFICKMEPMRIN